MQKKQYGDINNPRVKEAREKRGIDVLGNFGIPKFIPSERKKTEQLENSTNDPVERFLCIARF